MAALYDPRYNYPNDSEQRNIGSKSVGFRNYLLRNLYPDTVATPAQAAPAEPPTLDLEVAPALALKSDAPPPRPPHVNPKLRMQNAIANDPILQLMAGGNKQRVGPQETRAFFQNLHPDAQKLHAARIDGSHLASLEARDKNAAKQAAEIVTLGAGDQVESGDSVDLQQELYAAQNNANPGRSYRDMSQGAQDARGALASVNTSTSGELPVLATTPARPGSNSLTNLLVGLAYDAAGLLTSTSAEDVRANGIRLTHNGNEIFATNGQGNTAQVDEETAAAIEAATSGDGEQQQQNGPYFPEMPVAPAALTDTTTPVTAGNNNGALTVTGSQNTQQPANLVRASTGGYTGNARGSGLPDMQVGLGERMMRMGMAGLAAGAKGPLAQMGAMTGTYNDVNQANRDAEMGTFKIEEERRQAHAARVATLAASKNKGADAATDFSSMASSLTEMEGLYTMLGQENLTGPLMGTVGKWAEGAGLFDMWRSKPKDAMKAYARFQLQGLKVDDTLLRVAQTKGAISDAEMKLFQSDTPSMTDSEGVWQRYLNERMVVLRKALAAQGYALNAPVKVGTATVTLLP